MPAWRSTTGNLRYIWGVKLLGLSPNLAFAAATGVMYLEATGVTVKPAPEDAMALKDLLRDPTCTVGKIATLLRAWPAVT